MGGSTGMRHARGLCGTRARGNLPIELTSFVGRDLELDEVVTALTRARLVTLVGPGGVGKSRLALRTAGRVARAFPDGAWLVELGSLRDPALLAEHVAATLGLRDETGRWIVATLVDYIASRRMLLILDNCEHVLDACAVLVKALLQQGAGLRVVATSREPLRFAGEALIQVPPLDPAGAGLRLLVERTSTVRPDVEFSGPAVQIARELCRRLEGIPLAIELAAARLRGMPLAEVARRLDNRLELLTAGDRAAPERQQTMRATLDWSYDLLGDDERALWRRLAVFAGGFDAAAVQAVTSDDAVLPASRLPDTLARLVERSVLLLDDPVAGRYRLLEIMRDYAVERAATAGELDNLKRRHRDYYLGLARQASDTWGTGEAVRWFRRLTADFANLREALDQCRLARETTVEGLEVTARLGIAWQAIGRVGEGTRWLSFFLAATPRESPARPLGQWASGYMALLRRDLEVAQLELAEARSGASDVGDEATWSWAVGHLGLLELFLGRPAEARGLFLDSVDRHRLGGRPGVAAFMLADAALAASMLGETDGALAELDEAITVARQVGDQWTEAHALWGLAVTRLRRGEPALAEGDLIPALRLIREVGDATGTALAMEALSLAAAQLGRPKDAAALAGTADGIWGSIPARPPGPAVELRNQAMERATSAIGAGEFVELAERSRAAGPAVGIAAALGEDLPGRSAGRSSEARRPGLSRREREVAELVASGMTNRAIAERLVLSARTVESHIERIMNRLGVGSRAEIASWAARNLAPESPNIP